MNESKVVIGEYIDTTNWGFRAEQDKNKLNILHNHGDEST